MTKSRSIHMQLWAVLIILLLFFVQPAAAQVVPNMVIYFNWTPDEQLTTYNGDNRYVDAQIMLNGNVQFWALDITCTIRQNTALAPHPLEMQSISFPSGVWGTADTDYFVNPGTGSIMTAFNAGPATVRTLKFTITRVGASNTPVGQNGVNYTLPLANLRFQVTERTAAAIVTVSCVPISFMNRDGRAAAAGRMGVSSPLNIRVGYGLTGTARRQGAANHLNIDVVCTHLASSTPYGARTNSLGAFTFGGATTTAASNFLRDYGLYECVYRSNYVPETTNPNDTGSQTYDGQFLEARVLLDLRVPNYRLLPVTIRPGDYNGDDAINLADLNLMTANFNTIQPIFTNGDANGDTRVLANDLALAAGNLSLTDIDGGDGDILDDPILESHVLYSLGTDYNPSFVFPNSRVWSGRPQSGAIDRYNIYSTTRDFWATQSPDGMEYAYISVSPTLKTHLLYIGNTLNGIGVPFRMPIGFRYPEALAPSWAPDGSLIAWICTVNQVSGSVALAGLQLNEGDICYANRGDTLGSTVRNLGVGTTIFPPAWFEYRDGSSVGFALIYSEGGVLKYYDLASNSKGTIPGLPTDSDMPVVVNHYSGDSYLFYRWDNGSTYELRVALLETGNTYQMTSGVFSFGPTSFGAAGSASGVTNAVHMIITNATDPDYYDVSSMLDIMFYDGSDDGNIYNLGQTVAGDIEGNGSTNWLLNTTHSIDGSIGSPAAGGITGQSMRYAERITFDWIP